MPRNRVLSMMSQWGHQSPDSSPSTPNEQPATNGKSRPQQIDTFAAQSGAHNIDSLSKHSPTPGSPGNHSRARGDSRVPRPNSMIQTYQPPQVEVAPDTPPELQPIFSFLNSHSNKLYQEGYFLKLHDLDSRGRPSADRTWVESFAQLVGTVLSLWDAAALDLADVDGEVVPTFINLSDASLKMIESLPMHGVQGGKLQNVLSISTAANNRYLLHFNSLNSLTQWTAGIRLAMFEHSTLQEAYTGSLVAGKGKLLNNIKAIMERARFTHEDWARVRFGAGTPWKRCWCVVSPPDEKDYQKAQKTQKKGSSYGRAQVPKGDIKFYDSRKVTKKTRPIATISDAYAAYAIYPQSKPLIDQSTLVKMEGLVTIHSSPETTTEGFVFVMPEVHPAVTGFEMMLRWLFPVWDTFNMYGRPTRLIADTLDQRGLMFAMPRDRRYGHLDTLDVSGLIHTTGSQAWSERQWRRELKKLTSERMTTQLEGRGTGDEPRLTQRRNTGGSRTPVPSAGRGGVRFDDEPSAFSTPGSRTASPMGSGIASDISGPPPRVNTAPPAQNMSPHRRAVSDAMGQRRYQSDTPSRLSHEYNRPDDYPPEPPRHGSPYAAGSGRPAGPGPLQRIESGVATPTMSTVNDLQPPTPLDMPPPQPVSNPPAFRHSPSSRPANQLAVPPELRRAHSGVDAATLYQMQEAARPARQPEEDYDGNDAGYRVDTTTPTNLTLGVSNADRSQGKSGGSSLLKKKRDPRQRLSTIPGSPYVPDDGSTFQSMDPVGVLQSSHTSGRGSPVRSIDQTSQKDRPTTSGTLKPSFSIQRKPVTNKLTESSRSQESVRSPNWVDNTSSPQPSEHGSLKYALIDEDALEHILTEDARLNSLGSITSSATPDYASTTSRSTREERKPSMEKPRMGKLRTVGDPEMTKSHTHMGKLDPLKFNTDVDLAGIPNNNFGPTFNYTSTMEPQIDVSGTSRSRSHSRDRLRGHGNQDVGRPSPSSNLRHSYFGDGISPGGGIAQADTMQQAGNRHSIAWSPAKSPGPSGKQVLTPEQWVQYKASIAAQPQQPLRGGPSAPAHNRQNSSTSVNRMTTKTPPPFGRKGSGDWSQIDRRTPPSRPGSRGVGTFLESAGTNLSAKEQMHVSKATGTPLINMAANSKQNQDNYNPGLVGTLATREREKATFQKGMRNSVVEDAIRARQQQQAQLEAEERHQQSMRAQQQGQQSTYAYHNQQKAYAQPKTTHNELQPQKYYNQSQTLQQPQQYYNQSPPHQQQQYYAQQQASYPSGSTMSPYSPVYSSPWAQGMYDGQQQQQQSYFEQQGQQRILRQNSYSQGYYGAQQQGQSGAQWGQRR